MDHFEAKGISVVKVADTYTAVGKRCVDKIQSRYIKERHAMVDVAREHTQKFQKTVSDSIQLIGKRSEQRRRSLTDWRHSISRRKTSYLQAISAMKDAHKEFVTLGEGEQK